MSNIDALLQRLSEGTFAHELVSLLRAQPPDRWQESLKSFLEGCVTAEIEAYKDAANQASGD
jgi:hypothetical protein